jgi:hypothetical protein
MYHKQLKECKTKKDVVDRLKRTANVINESSNYTANDNFIENLTYKQLKQFISKEVERALNFMRTMEEYEDSSTIKEEYNNEFDIDEFMLELKSDMNDDIDDKFRTKNDKELDELIQELEDEILIEGFTNENKFVNKMI